MQYINASKNVLIKNIYCDFWNIFYSGISCWRIYVKIYQHGNILLKCKCKICFFFVLIRNLISMAFKILLCVVSNTSLTTNMACRWVLHMLQNSPLYIIYIYKTSKYKFPWVILQHVKRYGSVIATVKNNIGKQMA